MARAQGDVKGAMSSFDAALKIDPKNVAVRLSRASLNIAEGKYPAADEDLDPILKTSPDNFMASYLRALERDRQKALRRGGSPLRPHLPVFPRFAAGYYLQGATKYALGQYAEAEASSTSISPRFPATRRRRGSLPPRRCASIRRRARSTI